MTENAKPGSRVGLSMTVRHLISIASLAALGRESELARYIRAALAAGVDAGQIRETFLQVALLAGLPRAISALEALESVLSAAATHEPEKGNKTPQAPREPLPDAAALRARGEQAFRAVYGIHADTVLSRLETLHPFLPDWVLSGAYGAILARPSIPLTLREYVSVAVLAVLDQPLQLMAHMRGAMNAGGTAAALREVVSQVSLHLDEEQVARTLRILEKTAS